MALPVPLRELPSASRAMAGSKPCTPDGMGRKAPFGVRPQSRLGSRPPSRDRPQSQGRPSSQTRNHGIKPLTDSMPVLVRPYSSPATRDFRKTESTSSASQNRLKGIVGRRYLSEALEAHFADPLEKCKCRFALCAVQEIFGDLEGLAKQMMQTVKELRPLLLIPEAQDIFTECVEKLIKGRTLALHEQYDLLEESLQVAHGPRMVWLANEHRRCKERIRKKNECEYRHTLWAVAAPYVASFHRNHRLLSCVNRSLRDATRVLRDKSRERKKKCEVTTRIEPMFEPKRVDYPTCACGLAMIVRWVDPQLVFICRQGARGCSNIIQANQWRSLFLGTEDLPTPNPRANTNDDLNFVITREAPSRPGTVGEAFPTDNSMGCMPRPSSSPARPTKGRPTSVPAHSRGRKGDYKRFQGNAFRHFIESQDQDSGKKFARIPKKMLMDESMIKNQLSKLAHFSIRTKLENRDSMDKTYDNQLMSSIIKNKVKLSSCDALAELKTMVNSMISTVVEQDEFVRFAKESLGATLNLAKVDRRTSGEIECDKLQQAMDERRNKKELDKDQVKKSGAEVAKEWKNAVVPDSTDEPAQDEPSQRDTERSQSKKFLTDFFLGGRGHRGTVASGIDSVAESLRHIELEESGRSNCTIADTSFQMPDETLAEVDLEESAANREV